MTKRKQRQLERTLPEDKLLDGLRQVADRPFVRTVDDHFAGYFNELGVTFTLTEDAPDSDVISLRNDVLRFIEAAAQAENFDFTWQVSFWRGLQQVALLFPGNSEIPADHPLELIYL